MSPAHAPADERHELVRAAADPDRVRAALQAHFERSGRTEQVESVEVRRLFYIPGVDFTAVYAVRLRQAMRVEEALLFGNLRYDDTAAALATKAAHKLAKGKLTAPALGDAAYHLPELGMVAWTWPNDPKLKTLPAHLDGVQVRTELGRLKGPDGVSGDWEVGAFDRLLVRYIPRKRAVFRYEIEWRAARGSDGAPRAQPSSMLQTVYAKVYDNGESAARARDIQDALWRAIQSDGRALRVPRPLYLDDESHVLYAAELPGTHLALRASDVQVSQVAGIARGLASLQLVRLPVQESQPLEAEFEKLGEAVRLVAMAHPEHAATLAAIEAELARRLPLLPRLPLVPCHGTFKLAHLLDDGHRLSLVDFDSVVLADPLYDVANFTADLHYLEVIAALPAGRADRLGRAFHDSWSNHVPWGRRDAVLDWMVASLLIRKQALKPVKHLHAGAPAKIERLLQLASRRSRGRSA